MDAESGLGAVRKPPAFVSAHRDADESVAFGPFRLDSKRRVLTAGGREVALQPRAFDLLALFLGCRGQVLSNDEIIGHVWRGLAVGDNNLGVQLSALRRALAEHGGKGLIVTVPGRGYRFVGEVVSALPDLPLPRQAVAEIRPAHARRLAIGLGIAAMLTLTAGVAILVRRPPATVPSLSFNPPPHSVAVLAFANMSGDPAQEYFSDGLSEELIDLLSRVPALRVAGRTSSFSFKSKPATIAEIARTLNVGAVLEGSVRRQGNRLRITAALNDARTGYQLWAQDFDRDQADVFAMQTDIASAVTEALR